jgi:hypothetical protein
MQPLLIFQDSLNAFAGLPVDARRRVRQVIIKLLADEHSVLFQNKELNDAAFLKANAVRMHLPMHTTEFTDFSAAREHVANVSSCALMHKSLQADTPCSVMQCPRYSGGQETTSISAL